MSETAFSSLKLRPELLDNLATMHYDSMTPIQAQSLPLILAKRDIIAQGKTGSGKTAAFGLGLLNKLDVKRFRIQSLVLCPTRELADQVANEIRKLARGIHNIKVLTLCGGVPFGPQVGSLEHGAHIIVGTPGRVEEHVRKGTLVLNNIHTLVLDEADRMLDMGFQDALENIVAGIPEERQTLLLSATYPDSIKKIAEKYMREPELIKVESTHDNSSIAQHFYEISSDEQRFEAIKSLLLAQRPASAIIFCNTKRETQALADALRQHDISALALHGDLEQRDRDQTLVRFANRSINILVATDVAARGLDIDHVEAVYNYDIARDSEVHVHRIGRTGRAGSSGRAITLVASNELHRVKRIEAYTDSELTVEKLPTVDNEQGDNYYPEMLTIQIDGGKKQKVRAGDIVGALTRNGLLTAADLGKIQLFDNKAYVAVRTELGKQALKQITEGKMKGRAFRARILR